MSQAAVGYWRRIFIANLIAAALVVFVFSGATWRTPLHQLARSYGIAFLFATCIGPMLGALMPRFAPLIWRRVRFPFNWIAIAAAMTVVAMAGSVVAIGLLMASGVTPPGEFLNWFTGSARISIAITLSVGMFIAAYELMRARLAQATVEAQLASLESRVHPHFLFNTLNSIAALIHDDPDGAERMTERLASLLRSSLDQQSTPLAPLADELAVVRDYLAIEAVRFGNRLRCEFRVDDAALAARVPRLALQTLAENSVKYAVSPRREGGSITISAAATASQDAFVISVEDDGPGFDGSELPGGHGLAILRERLSLLFGERGGLKIEHRPSGTRVEFVVPHVVVRTKGADVSCARNPSVHPDASRVSG